MQPLVLILNIAIIVGIVGIVVYWVQALRGIPGLQSHYSRTCSRLRSC